MNEHVRRWVSVNATVHHDRGISPCFLRIHRLCPSWAVSAEKHSSTETTAPSTGQLWFHAACHISVQPETICKVCIISRYYHKTILSHARPHGVEKMSEWREVKHYNLKHHRRVQKKKKNSWKTTKWSFLTLRKQNKSAVQEQGSEGLCMCAGELSVNSVAWDNTDSHILYVTS